MRKNIKKFYFLLIVITTLWLFPLMHIIEGQLLKDPNRYLKNPIYQRRVELFRASKIKRATIVMLGNSLTEGGSWNDLLGRNDVVNRGISGDILLGYLNRMKYVYNLHPRICFIEGGINDIYNWETLDNIYHWYIQILEGLKNNGIIPVIQSTLYVGENWGAKWLKEHRPDLKPREVNKERNYTVKLLNKKLLRYAKRHNIIFIDLNKKLTKHGFLIPDYTWDGAHLKTIAYKIWGKEIIKVLKQLGI